MRFFAHVNYFFEKIQYIVICVSFPVHIQQNDFCLYAPYIYIYLPPQGCSAEHPTVDSFHHHYVLSLLFLTGGGCRLGVMAKAAVKKGTVLLLKAPKDSDEDRFVEV